MFVAVHGSSSMLPRSFKSKVMDPQVWKVRLLSSIGTHTKWHWKAHCRLLLGDYQPFVNAKLGCHDRVKKGPVDSSLEQFLQYVGRLMLNAFECVWMIWMIWRLVIWKHVCLFDLFTPSQICTGTEGTVNTSDRVALHWFFAFTAWSVDAVDGS